MTAPSIRPSSQVRKDFLDFFKSKAHTIVPSSSLMPASPNLLFTNAGMNQFVPIFLGQTKCPYTPGRAADTQKCIRAGGKHNDLDDVGLDTYHHTFFEMLGNWSFGDYFKREAIDWAWELVVGIWKFPPQRLYATVYSPDQTKNDPSEFDQEAWNFWAEKFRSVGLDPAVHIVHGSKKDNFWMMGETGPCGPCSELHVDLTPAGDTQGALVNKGSAECIEIWNLVFIQFNANPDGTFSPLPAKHVDTGMGFERVTSILQCTKNLTDFGTTISNYETDIFRPIFDAIEKLSGKRYSATLPTRRVVEDGKEVFRGANETENIDIAFRVIADHIRTVGFAIADGIQPGNKDRNAVIRRILRRAGLFGRSLGFNEPFFFKLVDVLPETMGDIFPELRVRKKSVQDAIRIEEEAFNKTLDQGLDRFYDTLVQAGIAETNPARDTITKKAKAQHKPEPGASVFAVAFVSMPLRPEEIVQLKSQKVFPGRVAFNLHDTYGFPIEETDRLAREYNLTVDKGLFKELMEEQRDRARAAQKKEVISVSQIETNKSTRFLGFDRLEATALVEEVVRLKEQTAIILDTTTFYAEMGGQVSDMGQITSGNEFADVSNTIKSGNTFLHLTSSDVSSLLPGTVVNVAVNKERRNAIQRHHTVTHLLHWALHEVASREASQKGSFVGPDKLTFDFNSAPLTPQQVADIEKLVNERILENAPVTWMEVKHNHVKDRKDVMQFFGDKYGEWVRVVQIGGTPTALDGYSMELCGGTHTRATGEIGLFRITGESAIAAGVRRVEAVAGLNAYDVAKEQMQLIRTIAGKINSPVHELDKKVESLLAHQKELEKKLASAVQRNAAQTAAWLLTRAAEVNGIPLITQHFPDSDGDYLQVVADALKGRFKGVAVLGGVSNGAVALVASVSPEFTAKVQAGKIIQAIAPIVGGKGGGKPDNARGGGKDVSKLEEALAKAKTLLE